MKGDIDGANVVMHLREINYTSFLHVGMDIKGIFESSRHEFRKRAFMILDKCLDHKPEDNEPKNNIRITVLQENCAT